MASLHKLKRQRVDLTGSEKGKICEVHQKLPELKHEELAKYMVEYHEFRLVSRSTISKLHDEQQKWLKVDSKLPEGSSRRSREPKWPEFAKALPTWFGQVREMKGTLSDVLLRKAHEFRRLIDISERDFKLSNGWLARFKARYGIAAYRDFHGESTDAVAPGAAITIFKLPDFVNCHNEAVEVDYIG